MDRKLRLKLLQSLNALLFMLLPLVIMTFFKEFGTLKLPFKPKIYPKCVFFVSFFEAPTKGSVISVKLLQPVNAPLPILVTLSGIFTFFKLSQPLNAETPMLVTESGIVTLARLLHP